MQVYKRLCFSSLWRRIIFFLTFRKISEPKCFRWGGSNPLEQNTRSHHWCVTFFSCTHPTAPSSPALICSPHSFRNDSTVIIQHFLVISVVIFFSNLTLLLHAFFLPFQKEHSHIFEICSYENYFFSLLQSPRADPSRWIDLQFKEEHDRWIQLHEELSRSLQATQAGLHT